MSYEMSHEEQVRLVGTSAESLVNECRVYLDDDSHVFQDGSGEAWVQQLNEMATRCLELNLVDAARELKAQAQQVERRTERW